MPHRNRLVYDDIYELCRDDVKLQNSLEEDSLIGDFSGIYDRCLYVKLGLRNDKSYGRDGYCWRCSNKKCNFKVRIREGSWFLKSHLTLKEIVNLTYYWKQMTTNKFSGEELNLSPTTVMDWFNFGRDVCTEIIKFDRERIGVPGKIVELDESKFGKRKNNKGRLVEGQWVLVVLRLGLILSSVFLKLWTKEMHLTC